jgi:hypothetical protein
MMTEVKPLIITTIDGESREARVYPDGAWDCPFCGGANEAEPRHPRPWPHPCGNPLCIAGGRGDAESVAAVRLEERRRREAASDRAWLARVQEEAAAASKTARDQECANFAALAEHEGYCVRCWGHSTSWGLTMHAPKMVRHRKPENCPLARRGTRI